MRDQPTDPADDRGGQQRRPAQAPADSGQDSVLTAGAADPSDDSAEVTTSRTLFSFLEPSLDRIGVYGAPMVLAGGLACHATSTAGIPRLEWSGTGRKR